MKRTEYYSEFIKAIKRTEEWGFDSGDITLDKSVSYIDEDSQAKLKELYNYKYKDVDEVLQMECTSVSLAMLELVQDHFCTDAYLTTGNVISGDISHFECTLDYLKSLTKDKKLKSKLHVHAWITLSSGEIIDFTFFRSMAKAFTHYTPNKDFIVTDLFIEKSDKIFIPMIIGADFYIQTGNMS